MSLLMPWNSWPAEGLTELAHPEVDPRPPVLSAGSGPVDKGKLSGVTAVHPHAGSAVRPLGSLRRTAAHLGGVEPTLPRKIGWLRNDVEKQLHGTAP